MEENLWGQTMEKLMHAQRTLAEGAVEFPDTEASPVPNGDGTRDEDKASGGSPSRLPSLSGGIDTLCEQTDRSPEGLAEVMADSSEEKAEEEEEEDKEEEEWVPVHRGRRAARRKGGRRMMGTQRFPGKEAGSFRPKGLLVNPKLATSPAQKRGRKRRILLLRARREKR
ncbi:hypothetical protein JRQ81_012283 [Phrynocephalus forsythii]|uniref:Uncharacterized protein n=1 Tax=Phrynocephalus forsythii TaxID=171643 RepID=A0A9Q0X652_9SAUR|nr:hypothetical protein JRQ81_012283 [Phrynocephalus forsythii]